MHMVWGNMAAKNKTKIICTIGPVSRSPEILSHLMLAGMDIARLNFSHGNFTCHKEDVLQIRQAAQKVGKSVAIMADLPGPKIRIGELIDEVIDLQKDDFVIRLGRVCSCRVLRVIGLYCQKVLPQNTPIAMIEWKL